jgi:hypothetical protein
MKLAFIFLFIPVVVSAQNTPPVVTNVIVFQQPYPSQLVDIWYDVNDNESDQLTIILHLSADGGSSWSVPTQTVYGDFGSGIYPGNHHIIWNAGTDYPGIESSTMKVRILADDGVISEGLVAYYPFNGNANDESGNGHHGVVSGPQPVADRFGSPSGAYMFDHSNQYIEVSAAPAFELTSWTICCWLNMDSFAGRTILGKMADGNGYYNFALISRSGDEITSQYETCSSGSDHYVYANGLGTGNWFFLISRRDESNGEHAVFVNANLVDAHNWLDLPCANSENFRIGITNYHSAFEGTIDDLRIYDYPLNELEILALYHEND